MFTVDVQPAIGSVNVKTTENEGLSPEYWTERIMEKLVSVATMLILWLKHRQKHLKQT